MLAVECLKLFKKVFYLSRGRGINKGLPVITMYLNLYFHRYVICFIFKLGTVEGELKNNLCKAVVQLCCVPFKTVPRSRLVNLTFV